MKCLNARAAHSIMRMKPLLIFTLLFITNIAQAQFDINFYLTCNDPYIVFSNANLPEVIDQTKVKALGIKSVTRYGMSFDPEGVAYVKVYYNTDFNKAGQITSHQLTDSTWIESKKSWNLMLFYHEVFYSQENVDSIHTLSLSACRHLFKENAIYHSTCYPNSPDVESYREFTNRKFDKKTEKYRPYTAHWESADYLVKLANMDLFNSPSLGYDSINFTNCDTIWGLPKAHGPTPTWILNSRDLLVREIQRITLPEYISGWKSAPRIDYIYDLQGELTRKRYINFENSYSGRDEFYFYNDDGLISSTWILSEGRLELESKFLYEKY